LSQISSIAYKRELFQEMVSTSAWINNIPSSLIVTSGLEVVYLNKALTRFFNVPDDYALSKFTDILPFVHKEDWLGLLKMVKLGDQSQSKSFEFQIRVYTNTKKLKYVKASTSIVKYKETIFSLTSFIDITGEILGSQSLTNMLDAMHIGMVLIREKTLVFSNKRLNQMLPTFPKPTEGLEDFIREKFDKSKSDIMFNKLLRENDVDEVIGQELEVYIRGSYGGIRWFLLKRLEDVHFNGLNTVAMAIEDITESKLLQYEASRANTLFETIQEPAVIATFNGYFTKVNPAFCELLGYTADELLTIPYLEFISAEDRQFSIAGNKRYLSGQPSTINSENTYITKNGKRIILSWIAVPDYEQELLYATARNVSKERAYEQHILESEAELKRTLRIAQLGSWSMKGLWGEESWNYETRIIFDVGPDEKANLSKYIVLSDRERYASKVKKCLEQRSDFDDVFQIISSKEEIKYIRIIGESHNEEEALIKGIIQDVTTIRKAELKMMQALKLAEEAARLKSEFLSVMSHEIRTPMNAVIGMAHLLLENDPREDQIDEIQTLQFAANNLLALINDILDFSKAEAGKIKLVEEQFNVHDFFKNMVRTFEPMSSMKGIKLSYNIHEDVPLEVISDKTRLSQILNNLIGNAVKFTEAGKVDCNLSLGKIAVEKKEAELIIAIKDTGIGIPDDMLVKIFDSFTLASAATSRKYGGTGLGLAITKKLIELFEGSVTVKSEPNEGTTFTIKLSLNVPDDFLQQKGLNILGESPEQVQQNLESFVATKRLLVVDDNRVNLKIVGKFLSKWSVNADYVESGFDALDKLTAGEKYDLVLMDLQMPELDGFETTRKIHELENGKFSKLPVIALTAEVLGGVHEKVIEYGMKYLISKPFNPKDLMEKIAEYTR
jgi:PAS domain S-box-containing protein